MTVAAFAPLEYASRPTHGAANDNDDAIIDLFAGGGGASEGIFWATGRHPDIAVNHDREAIDMHRTNHPSTYHVCEDIRKVDAEALVRERLSGRKVGLLWASPDCRHHSKASGGALKDRGIRGLAWEVLRWAAAIKRATGEYPGVIALENVEEFQDWCPVHRYGRRAGKVMKSRRGETFKLWKGQFESLGATVHVKELVAANYGAPTTRKRLFVVIEWGHARFQWPDATHAPADKIKGDLFDSHLQPWRTAANDVIDWSIPCPSIFDRKKALAPKTQKRIAKGIERFVIRAPRPYIVPITHTGERPVGDIDAPLKTVTSANRGEFALTTPHLVRTDMHKSNSGCIFPAAAPLNTITSGGGFALCSSHITKFRSGAIGSGIDQPLPTVTANSFIKRPGGSAPLGRVDVMLGGASVGVGGRAGQSPARGLDQAVNTLTAKGDRAIAVAYLTPRYGERPGQDPRVLGVDRPYPAVVPDGNGGSLTTVTLGAPLIVGAAYGDDRARAGLRAWNVGEPLRVVTSGGRGGFAIATAFLGRQFGTNVSGRSAKAPLGTVMSDGAGGKNYLVTPLLSRLNKGSVGTDLRDPALTATGRVKDALIAPLLTTYYGSGENADRVNEPLRTATVRDRFSLASAFLEQANTGMVGHDARKPISTIVAGGGADCGWGTTQRVIETRLEAMGASEGSKRRKVLTFLWEHFGAPTEGEWADPMGSPGARLKFGLVIIDDVCWQITDIGMRMLVPRELFNAQGFKPTYEIEVTWEGRKLTKTAQTAKAGNSVCPHLAEAIIRAALPERMLLKRAA